MFNFLDQFVEVIRPSVQKQLPAAEIKVNADKTKVRISALTHQNEERLHQRYQPIIIQINEDVRVPNSIDASLRSQIQEFIETELRQLKLQTIPSAETTPKPICLTFPEKC